MGKEKGEEIDLEKVAMTVWEREKEIEKVKERANEEENEKVREEGCAWNTIPAKIIRKEKPDVL